ncbi:hypothetical protein B0T10DRAFT_458339 [Thelonectria olida]|uniref:Uncharacterized protein n=1 Tax=Thelonectria olida TaxID=1576542 RepID=A0A9P8W7X3_9HYPO|nr:hypothetical protein B0T10DRAFT_458339 [Thelonectria olida]
MGGFFSSHWFNPKFKFRVHIGQFVLVAVIVALAVAKIVTRPSYMPMNRMDIVGITMGMKTVIVLSYQLLTEHVSGLRKWGSLRAYAILNSLEVVFWAAVIGVTFYGISMICVGISCAFGWLIALASFVMVCVRQPAPDPEPPAMMPLCNALFAISN